MNRWRSTEVTFLPPKSFFRKNSDDESSPDNVCYLAKRQEVLASDAGAACGAAAAFGAASAFDKGDSFSACLDSCLSPHSSSDHPYLLKDEENKLCQLLLMDNEPDIQLKALNFLAERSAETSLAPVDTIVSHLLKLLESPHEGIVEKSLWALANIIDDYPEYSTLLNIIFSLETLISVRVSENILARVSWCFANLCRFDFPITVLTSVVDLLERILQMECDAAMQDVCWALTFITPDERIALDEKSICVLIKFLQKTDDRVLLHLIFEVLINGVILQENGSQTFIQFGGLQALKKALEADWIFNCYAAFAVSNICAGTPQQIQAVLDAEMLPILTKYLADGKFKIRSEAAWAIGDIACNGSDEQIRLLAQHGVLKSFVRILALNDVQLMMISLVAIEKMVEACDKLQKIEEIRKDIECSGLLDLLDNMKYHENEEISESALALRLRLMKVDASDGNDAEVALVRLRVTSPQGDGP